MFVCGLKNSAGLGNRVREAASSKCSLPAAEGTKIILLPQKEQQESKDDDEDETDSVENFLLGDSSGGAQLDTCGPQRTQRGSKQGECGSFVHLCSV